MEEQRSDVSAQKGLWKKAGKALWALLCVAAGGGLVATYLQKDINTAQALLARAESVTALGDETEKISRRLGRLEAIGEGDSEEATALRKDRRELRETLTRLLAKIRKGEVSQQLLPASEEKEAAV